MKNSTIRIGHENIYPGERLSLALPLPEFFSCAPIHMPIKVVHGKSVGPCLLMTAAMYGNAFNGTEIINRVLASPAMKKLKGTLIAIPVMNVYGFMNRSKYLPGGINLDRCFPGTKNGTHASRMAHIFVSEIFNKCDVHVDFQTGLINHRNLPQIQTDTTNERCKALAKSFNAPVISKAICEKGMLKSLAVKKGMPFLVYLAGEAMRFDEKAIRFGVKGTFNVMRHLGMLSEQTSHKPHQPQSSSFIADKNTWLRSPGSGVSHSPLQLGQHVHKNDKLCTVSDPFGAADTLTVRSPYEGIVVGINKLPLVHEGEALFQLARFPKMENAATHLEAWHEKTFENKSV